MFYDHANLMYCQPRIVALSSDYLVNLYRQPTSLLNHQNELISILRPSAEHTLRLDASKAMLHISLLEFDLHLPSPFDPLITETMF
jgi:hypothetical protein